MLGLNAKAIGRARVFIAAVMALAVLGVTVGALSADDGVIEVEIQVSPHVLNVAAFGEEVTVHTDIKSSQVVPESVTFSGIELSGYGTDARGFFVAKVEMSDLLTLDLEAGESYEFVLEGETVDGEPFAGEEEILIVSNRGAPGRRK